MTALNEWIEHDGKGAPDLAPGTRVNVKFECGESDEYGGEFEMWDWEEEGTHRIVAYRVVYSSAD